MDKPKSILDGVPVSDKAFPLRGAAESMRPADPTCDGDAQSDPPKVIVGHCPKCGAPIYGSERIAATTQRNCGTGVVYSCSCRYDRALEHQTK